MIRVYIIEADEITDRQHQLIHRYIRDKVSPESVLFKLHSAVLH